MQSFGAMAAEYWRAAAVHAWPWPAVASRDFLCSLTPPPRFPPPEWFNRLAFDLGDQLVWLLARPILQQVRAAHGLGRAGFTPDLRRAIARGEPLLLPYSEAFLPRSREWPGNIHVTGYWRLERSDEWRPSAALASFLDQAPAPVHIGFGSMVMKDPEATFRLVVEAARAAGVRAVVNSGWGGLTTRDRPIDVHLVDDVPHDWLFSRVSAIVHHGGAGTTGAALGAGKPSIVVPFILDQFFWAQQLHARGVAPRPTPFRTLTSQALAAAIREALNDETMRKRAQILGAAVAAEDGLAKAVAIVEAAARSPRRGLR